MAVFGGGLGGLVVEGLRNEADLNMSCHGRVEDSGFELGSEYGTNSIAIQQQRRERRNLGLGRQGGSARNREIECYSTLNM